MRVLGIQGICHFTSMDIGYYPIWETVFNILVTFRDIEYFGKSILGYLLLYTL